MKVGVSLKINVSQIDKARLFSGSKGMYLDATVFVDINDFDQYGNSGMITQDVTKDEKAGGVKGNILGNCKVFWSDGGTQSAPAAPPQQGYQAHNQRAAQLNQQAQQGYQQAPQQQAPVDVDFDNSIPF